MFRIFNYIEALNEILEKLDTLEDAITEKGRIPFAEIKQAKNYLIAIKNNLGLLDDEQEIEQIFYLKGLVEHYEKLLQNKNKISKQSVGGTSIENEID